jgi:hypothetical protein
MRRNLIRKEYIIEDLGIYKINDKLRSVQGELEQDLTRMTDENIPLMVYKYRSRGRRDLERPRKRWSRTKEDGTGILPNP